MKHLHLATIFILLSISVFGQEWKAYKIDDSVQVSLPEKFTRKDTLGQTMISSDAPFGRIQITISPDNPKITPDIEQEKHLQLYYDDFVNRIKTSAKEGIISNERDTMLGKLKVKDFSLSVDSGSGKQIRNFRILHVNSNTYTFQYLYQDIHAEYALPESMTFFSSLRIPPEVDVRSQFTKPANTTGETPAGTNRMVWIAGGIAFLILVFFLILTARKRRS